MSRIDQFTLDLGDGAPPITSYDSKTAREFGGKTYDPQKDRERLNGQYERVWNLMADSKWRTLAQIALVTGSPQASVSARLRDFRKPANGGHTVESKRVVGAHGLFIYRLIPRSE